MAASPSAVCSVAVVKIASRCNLNCSYCYMYNLGDETWREQPGRMKLATVEALLSRVRDHCMIHQLDHFHFVLHGGEPLLAGQRFIRDFVSLAHETLGGQVKIRVSVQTNATLLTPAWCALLKSLDVRVGVSLDGPQEAHDRHRVDHLGRGSYGAVMEGWRHAQAAGLDPGALVVVDPSHGAREFYAYLKTLQPRVVDFLLPEATHATPPRRGSPEQPEYADWLLEIFEAWVEEVPFRIRLFEQIVGSVVGLKGGLDSLGPGPNGILVVETDGSLEPIDVLRVCRSGITRTTRNVRTDTFDAALADPLIRAYYHSNLELCDECRACPLGAICAGGYFPHRYREPDDFDNPSVYCADLYRLIARLQHWTLNNLPEAVRHRTGLIPAPALRPQAVPSG